MCPSVSMNRSDAQSAFHQIRRFFDFLLDERWGPRKFEEFTAWLMRNLAKGFAKIEMLHVLRENVVVQADLAAEQLSEMTGCWQCNQKRSQLFHRSET